MLSQAKGGKANPWAFAGWVDVSIRQQRAPAMVSALCLVAAWYDMRDELGSVGRVELEGVMARLVQVAPECLLMELEPGQAQAALWLLRLGLVPGGGWCWTLGGDRLDVEVLGLWLEGCGLSLV